MPRLYIIMLLMLSLALGACAKRNKVVSVQTECTQMIQQAVDMYNAHRARFDEVQGARIANLIDAARIDQEHAEYAACMDKAGRALVLANQPGTPDK